MFHVEHIVTMTMTGNIVKTDKNKKTRNKGGLAGYGGFGNFVFHSRFLRMSGARYLHSRAGFSCHIQRDVMCRQALEKPQPPQSARKARPPDDHNAVSLPRLLQNL
jgi:hypothetical protein